MPGSAVKQGEVILGWLQDMLGGRRDRDAGVPLYNAIIARGREPHWYVEGAVPDTLDGRFDMIAAVLALVQMRLESEPEAAAASVHLTERFVDDMDAQIREIGFGDVVVGKHVGRMIGMLGGRLGAYREGLAEGTLDAALVRNLYRGEAPDAAAVTHVRDAMIALHERLRATSLDALLAGKLP